MIELTDQNFEEIISKSEKPILVDYWANWCNPCHILGSILEKLAEEFKENIIFAKANVEEIPKISQKFGIDRIPTVILFKEGKPVSGFFGVRPEETIRDWLKENLLIKEYEDYAKKNGLKLNPDKEVTERIIRGLLENEKKYGFRYCPCRRISGNPEEDKSKICPCQFMRKEIEENGHCLCGLFWKE